MSVRNCGPERSYARCPCRRVWPNAGRGLKALPKAPKDLLLPADHYWDPTWLALADSPGGTTIAVDVRSSPSGTGRVRFVEWSDTEFYDTGTDTPADLIRLWLGIMADYEVTWSSETRTWAFDYASIPYERGEPAGL